MILLFTIICIIMFKVLENVPKIYIIIQGLMDGYHTKELVFIIQK